MENGQSESIKLRTEEAATRWFRDKLDRLYISAMIEAQTLEFNLVSVIYKFSLLKNAGEGKVEWNKVEDYLAFLLRSPLDRLLKEFLKLYGKVDTYTMLEECKQQRNYLVHRFFIANGNKVTTIAGIIELVDELDFIIQFFKRTNERIITANKAFDVLFETASVKAGNDPLPFKEDEYETKEWRRGLWDAYLVKPPFKKLPDNEKIGLLNVPSEKGRIVDGELLQISHLYTDDGKPENS